ncbi:MAG TPA: c-type cytochrome [Terriglobia bacterium]
MGRLTLLAAVIVLLAFLTQPRARAADAQTPSPELIERGSGQYQQSCGFCHGPDATGARGPDLVRSKIVADDVNGNLIGQLIRSGRPDKGMPALPLNDDQIKAVAAFLHDRARAGLDSARLPKNYALAKLLTGNPEAGKTYFDGPGGCATCHSTTGDLKGIAHKLAPLDLEARMLYPGAAAKTVTVLLASGESVQGKLVRMDDFSVALLDSAGWYHSYSRDSVMVEINDPLEAHRALLKKISQKEFHDLFAYLETLK